MNEQAIECRDLKKGRLSKLPDATYDGHPWDTGEHTIKVNGKDRYFKFFMPTTLGPQQEAPLVIFLHGTQGLDGGAVETLTEYGRQNDAVVLAPRALDTTWDILRGGYGEDVEFIDAVLQIATRHRCINRQQLFLAGFSDGAAYALTLGLKNGDIFTDLWAFAPGFILPANPVGRPRITISHGKADTVLPFHCGEGIAQALRRQNYSVKWAPFEGGHEIESGILAACLSTLSSTPDSSADSA